MDWADDIAFSVHDVEDFYRAGLIPLDYLIGSQNERTKLFTDVLKRWRDDKRPEERAEIPQQEDLIVALESFVAWLPFNAPFRNTQKGHSSLRLATSVLINRYVEALELNEDAVNNPMYRAVKKVDLNYRVEIRILKELTWRYVINRSALATQQQGKRRVI